jgi:Xaa-Pro dipeptidase
MISRRKFLEVGGSAAGIAAVASAPLAAGSRPVAEDTSLPPSIARLKSRKKEATPITLDERRERLERARRLMSENSIDAIIVMAGTCLQYFTGIHWWGGERMFALVQPAKGTPFYVCPAFEEGRAREQIGNSSDRSQADVRVWQEDESPYQLVAQGLKDRGLATGKVGIEESIRFVFADGIAKAAPQSAITSATPVTAGCRMIKSPHEIALMRLAAHVTLAAYQAAYEAVKDGLTQPQVEDLVRKAHEQLGFQGYADVQVGEFSAFPHGSVTPQVVHEGTIVLMDGGCVVEGYQSDITRTYVLGRASDKMKQV